MIAIEPVIAPAAILSAISAEFEAMLSVAGPAAQGARLDPRVVGDRRQPRRRVGGACLDERVLGERLPLLRRQLDLVRHGDQLQRAEDLAKLAELVLVAGRDHRSLAWHQASEKAATASSWASRRRAIAGSARASSTSRDARETGVRSAVACTSTSPPSPLITTFASTSAW